MKIQTAFLMLSDALERALVSGGTSQTSRRFERHASGSAADRRPVGSRRAAA